MKRLIIYAEDEYFFVLHKFKLFLSKNNIDSNITDEEATKLIIKYCVANWYDEKKEISNFVNFKQTYLKF
jgi:hypothetical protein